MVVLPLHRRGLASFVGLDQRGAPSSQAASPASRSARPRAPHRSLRHHVRSNGGLALQVFGRSHFHIMPPAPHQHRADKRGHRESFLSSSCGVASPCRRSAMASSPPQRFWFLSVFFQKPCLNFFESQRSRVAAREGSGCRMFPSGDRKGLHQH